MTTEPSLQVGDVAEVVQISICAGGLVRTWTGDGTAVLWAVPDAELTAVQGTGRLARTPREENRFREAALLTDTGALILRSRFTAPGDNEVDLDAHVTQLAPATQPTDAVAADLNAVLRRAIRHCLDSGEFLLVEEGGWDAPFEPFCLWIAVDEPSGPVSVIETAPAPRGSKIWEPHIVPGRPSDQLRAPATEQNIEVAPMIMLEAIATWGIEPWDLALTFGHPKE